MKRVSAEQSERRTWRRSAAMAALGLVAGCFHNFPANGGAGGADAGVPADTATRDASPADAAGETGGVRGNEDAPGSAGSAGVDAGGRGGTSVPGGAGGADGGAAGGGGAGPAQTTGDGGGMSAGGGLSAGAIGSGGASASGGVGGGGATASGGVSGGGGVGGRGAVTASGGTVASGGSMGIGGVAAIGGAGTASGGMAGRTAAGGAGGPSTCGSTGAGGASDGSAWATWPAPNTPGLGLPNERSYTVMTLTGGDVVVDNVTGLMWQRAMAPGDYDVASATSYCETLALGGLSGWRLPAMVELGSILNFARTGPAIDVLAFPNALPNQPGLHVFWSSTPAASSNGANVWVVDFGFGQFESFYTPTDRQLVRCVRGGGSNPAAAAPCRYTVVGGQVLDKFTALIWQQSALTGQFDWADAQTQCAMSTVGAVTGWRLPTASELMTLLDLSVWRPAIDVDTFPGTPADQFWTSTPLGGFPGSAWNIDFLDGFSGTSLPTSSGGYVRCVR